MNSYTWVPYLGSLPPASNDCLWVYPHLDEPLRLPDELGGEDGHAGGPVTYLLVLHTDDTTTYRTDDTTTNRTDDATIRKDNTRVSEPPDFRRLRLLVNCKAENIKTIHTNEATTRINQNEHFNFFHPKNNFNNND